MTSESSVSVGYTWPWRARVAVSAIFLIVATLLVRNVRLSAWRWTLGGIVAADDAPPAIDRDPRAALLAAAVDRAAVQLPFTTKCLARAIAVQWWLRLIGLSSELVLAVHRFDRSGDDTFHAWVEHAGEMIIGTCDRAVYQPVLTLSQIKTAAAADRV